jgi:hypothetical protein
MSSMPCPFINYASPTVFPIPTLFSCWPMNFLPTPAIRNPSRMTANGGLTNLYSGDIEIDHWGDEVMVDNLVKVLLGKQHGKHKSTLF